MMRGLAAAIILCLVGLTLGCPAKEDGAPLFPLEAAGDNVLVAAKTLAAPTLDGDLAEEPWQLAPAVVLSGEIAGSMTVRALWDANHLYLGVRVNDTQQELSPDSDLMKDDAMVFHVDAGNERGFVKDANDTSVTASIRNLASNPNVLVRVRRVASIYYTMEVRIPWSVLKTQPQYGKIFGLLLENRDRDAGVLKRFDWLGLIARELHCRPVTWGSLYLGSAVPEAPPAPSPPGGVGPGSALGFGLLTARRLCDAITVDGNLSESAWAASDYTQFSQPSVTGNTTRVRSTWTDTHLYFVYEVTDTQLEQSSGEMWRDDGVSLYLDIGLERNAFMDGNDFQLLFSILGEKLDALSEVAVQQTPAGYVIEVGLPWSALSASPAADASYGLLVTNTDRDNGGTEYYDWVDAAGRGGWLTPSLWGTLTLKGPFPLP